MSEQKITSEELSRLSARASESDELITSLKSEINELFQALQEKRTNGLIQRLTLENKELRNEVTKFKEELINLEQQHKVAQIKRPPFPRNAATTVSNNPEPTPAPVQAPVAKPNTPDTAAAKASAKTKAEKKPKAAPPAEKQPESEAETEDVGRLDFRVGRIVSAKKHPDADALYVEDIDLGEEKNRTVVSGLVRFVPLEEMQDRMVVLLCNLKPAKMRGVLSEAMVMCASTPEKVEILSPPAGSVPGDLVIVEGYERHPDAVLNPKHKVFEKIAPNLKTNADRVATFKGAELKVPGKGVITAPSLTGVQVK